MKKIFLTLVIPMLIMAQLCACNGVEDPQPDDSLTLDFSALREQVQDGAEVTEIEAVERDGNTVGYIVTFADGSGLTLLNQTADGAQGSEVKSFGEDSESWWFELESGEKIYLPKAAGSEPFKVEISGDEVELTDGGSMQAAYKVSGAKGLDVSVMAGEDWDVEITMTPEMEGTIKVSAPNPITTDKVLVSFKDEQGRQVVRALRLTTKSAVKKGNIEIFAYAGVYFPNVNPELVGEETALRRYQYPAKAGIQLMAVGPGDWWRGYDYSEEALIELDLAEKVGIKLVLNVDRFICNENITSKFVTAVKDHPALWGYQIMDEPNADDFATLLRMKNMIAKYDDKHNYYINLNGDGGTFGPAGSYHTANYVEYLERYVEELDPAFISFDVYPCFSDWVLNKDWYPTLEQVSQQSRKSGIGFWAFAASCRFSDGYGLRMKPTEASLRLQQYTNLAYGAECLEYFTWSAAGEEKYNFGDWPTDKNGDINTTNPSFEYVLTLNKEIQNRAFVYDGCDMKWAAHYNDIPDRCVALDAAQLPEELASFSSESDLLFTLIENDGGMSEYLNVMSRVHYKKSSIHLRFRHPVQTVERDGSLKTYNPGDYDFTIDPGDILIIKTK